MITTSSLINEIIYFDPSLITVVERFGLWKRPLEETIDEAAKRRRANPHFVVEILKAYSNKDYFLNESSGLFLSFAF